MKLLSLESIQQIRELVRNCGQQAEKMAANPYQVTQKGPDDFVTSVDFALDQQLSAGFTALFPGDGVVTEENVRSRQAFYQNHSQLWLIDPLDGTEDFIQGKRDYAVMVGLMQNYQPIAGWVYAPAYDRLYYGGSDWGIFQATGEQAAQPIVLAAPPPPSVGFCPIVIGNKDQARYGAAITQLIPDAQFSSLGSFGLKVMEVILGRAGLYLYFNGRVKLWDTTGPLALARAAGLVCCDLDATPIRFTPDAIDAETLAHKQPILIGWSHYIDLLRTKLKAALALSSM